MRSRSRGAAIVVAVAALAVSGESRADSFTYIDRDGQEQTVSARLHGSGQGMHALLTADGQIRLVPEPAVRKREAGDGPAPVTPDEMAALLTEKFGADRTRTLIQPPFVTALVLAGPLEPRYESRTKGFLQKAGRFMLNVDAMFRKFAADMKFPAHDPEFPLVLIVFEADRDFNDFTLENTGGQGLSEARIAGFYSKLTNWLAIRMEECRTFQVPLHEAIHQQMYNRVLQRLAPIPAWFDEGIATGFESNGERIDVNPAKINSLYAFAAKNMPQREVSFSQIINDDDSFHGDILAAQAYVQAWSLHWMLVTQHGPKYQAYVRELAAREPLQDLPAEERTSHFEQTFGASVRDLERDFSRVLDAGLKRQRVQSPQPPPVGLIVKNEALGEVRMSAVTDVASGRLRVEGALKNNSPLRPLTFHVAVVTDVGVYTEWVVPGLANGKSTNLPMKFAAKVLPGAPGGISDRFTVRVQSVLPESAEAAEWQRDPPLPAGLTGE